MTTTASPSTPYSDRTWIWLAVVLVSGAAAIASVYVDGGQWLHWICKPLTTLLITAMALRSAAVNARYRRWVVIGLLCSTLGDVFLMLPGDHFAWGLSSFLIAHCAYLLAFTRRARWFASLWPFAGYAALALTVLYALWPGVPPALRVPVALYVLALASMAAQATAMWHHCRDGASAQAAAGGAFFLLSDGLLAWNRFVTPLDGSRLSVLATYWIAQWLIARSVAREAPGLTA